MGFLEWLIGAFVLIVAVLVFMQPLSVLFNEADSVISNQNTVKRGTDSSGVVVEVGYSFWGADLILAFVGLLGLAMVVGFIIWSFKGSPGYDKGSGSGFREF